MPSSLILSWSIFFKQVINSRKWVSIFHCHTNQRPIIYTQPHWAIFLFDKLAPHENLVVTLVDLMKTSSKTSCSCFLNNSRWKHNLSSKKEKDESISIGVMTLFLCDNRAFIGKMSSWRTFTAREEITNIKCIHTHIWSVSCIYNLKKRWKQGVMHLYIGKKDESISIGVMSCIYNLNF